MTLTLGMIGCGSAGIVGGLDRAPTAIRVSLDYSAPLAVNLENNPSAGLALVNSGSSLAVSVDGCASGYTVGSSSTPQPSLQLLTFIMVTIAAW